MSDPTRAAERERACRSLYDAAYADLLRFVQRRAPLDQAEDVVADAFLVVWRRLDELPARHEDARAWIFGISRNLLLNEHRGEQRRRALGVRLADTSALRQDSAGADAVVDLVDLAAAWRRLSDVHQEVLALVVFEDLSAPQAAAVLGISPVALRLRLSRARRALRLHLSHVPQPSGPPAGLRERTTRS